jgi:hypothetical protein
LAYPLRGSKWLIAELVKNIIAGYSFAAIGSLLGILLALPANAQTPPNLIEEMLPNGLGVTILPDKSHLVIIGPVDGAATLDSSP